MPLQSQQCPGRASRVAPAGQQASLCLARRGVRLPCMLLAGDLGMLLGVLLSVALLEQVLEAGSLQRSLPATSSLRCCTMFCTCTPLKILQCD